MYHRPEFFNRIGRKLPFKIAVFDLIECPVSVKADIQELAPELSARNDRFKDLPWFDGHFKMCAIMRWEVSYAEEEIPTL